MYKICTRCNIKKGLEDYHKNKRTKDGYHYECKNCVKEYKKTNKEILAQKRKIYVEENKEKISENRRLYYQLNKEKELSNNKLYSQSNRDRIYANMSKRRATKLNATPNWLSEKDLEEIRELYQICQMFKLYTGQDYHVDHIIPLQGKDVCGLHVPWNLQVILASENLRKSNKLLQ